MHALYCYDPPCRKFTGKEQDSESGLDNFGARYYGSSFGRFMTPDWAARPTTVPYAAKPNHLLSQHSLAGFHGHCGITIMLKRPTTPTAGSEVL